MLLLRPHALSEALPARIPIPNIIQRSERTQPLDQTIDLDRDDDKLYSWPVYAANLRARIRYPVDVLVVTPDPAVATG